MLIEPVQPTTTINIIIYQLVKLHNAVTIQMLHNVVTFENVTSCCNIVLLHDVTL